MERSHRSSHLTASHLILSRLTSFVREGRRQTVGERKTLFVAFIPFYVIIKIKIRKMRVLIYQFTVYL